MRIRACRALLAAVAVVPTLAGCSAGIDGVTAGDGSLPPVEIEAGVVHVHGLGVDLGDGTLYAATHSGLFKILG